MASLEGWNSTIELHPQSVAETASDEERIAMAGAGFEPAKALPPDLQSGPFGHSGIPPILTFASGAPQKTERIANKEASGGI